MQDKLQRDNAGEISCIKEEKAVMLKIADLLAQERLITPDEKVKLVNKIREAGISGCSGQ